MGQLVGARWRSRLHARIRQVDGAHCCCGPRQIRTGTCWILLPVAVCLSGPCQIGIDRLGRLEHDTIFLCVLLIKMINKVDAESTHDFLFL